MIEQKGKNAAYKKKSQLLSIWHRFKKNKLALFGLIVFAVMLFIAVFADFIVDYERDAITQHMADRFKSPSPEHIFGTDGFGRDMFARIIFGARISLFVGVVTIALALVAGAVIGASAGYYGGRIDEFLMRIMDVFLAIPQMILAIAIVAALGTGMFNILIALTVAQVPKFARIVRAFHFDCKNPGFH